MVKECKVSAKTIPENLAATIIGYAQYDKVELTAIGRNAASVAIDAIRIAQRKAPRLELAYTIKSEYFPIEDRMLPGNRITVTKNRQNNYDDDDNW